MITSPIIHGIPLWGMLASLALLTWATVIAGQLFSTWRWSTELLRKRTSQRRSFRAPQPRYYF